MLAALSLLAMQLTTGRSELTTAQNSFIDGIEFYYQQDFCVSYLNVVFPEIMDVKEISLLYDATYLKDGNTSENSRSKFWFVIGEARNPKHKSIPPGRAYLEIDHENYPLEFFEWTGNKVQMGITNLFPPMPESVYIELKSPGSALCSKTFRFESISETETELLGRKLIPANNDKPPCSLGGNTVFAPMGR